MAKLPGVADLGPTPSADSARPTGSYDVSAITRGGQAMAQGAEKLGAGVAKFGEGVGEYALDENRWDYAKANSFFLSGLLNKNETTKNDTNYGPDDNGKSLVNRHAESVWGVQDEAAKMIRDPRMRERFMVEAAPQVERSIIGANEHARGLSNKADTAYTLEQGDASIDQMIKAPDDETRRQLVDSHNQLVDGLVAKGAIDPVQARAMKQDWAKKYATADLLARADQDPLAVINELRAAPGSASDITNRILRIEGTGKNPSSSASGAGQFIDSTWLDVLKRNRPDLANGRSDEQLLALRADKNLGRDMTEALRSENEAFLVKKGLPATPGNQYLAHFLGAGGAAAVIQADPNAPIADVLTKAVGAKQAQAMISANPTILNGQLAGSVQQWANNKMGGATPGGGSIYDILRPDERETILAHARTQLQKQNVDDISGFQTRIQDAQAEAVATGNVTKPITEGEFIGKLGAQHGPQAFKIYSSNVQLGKDIAGVSKLDPMEQDELLKSYGPKPGDGYAQGLQRQVQVKQAIDKANKDKSDDPGGFAISRLPATGPAYQAFVTLKSNPTADPKAVQEAARTFASTSLLEQQQVGIPADAQKILPKGYADAFNARISKPVEAGGTLNVVATIEKEAQLWGDNWPKVYRELGKDSQPVVRVIGSGIKPAAAQILAETAHISLGDILKDQDAEKSATVKKDVLDAFKPLAASMAGNEGAIRTFNDFRAQGEKLAAYYVMRGASASDAATQAFNDLVGHKYNFADTYRIPKSVPLTPDQVASGVSGAKQTLDKLDVMPARDTIGGLTPEYLKSATTKAYARDGIWVTAPDESGLALVYKDQAVRRKDGTPLILSWDQLGKMGQAYDKPYNDAVSARGTIAP